MWAAGWQNAVTQIGPNFVCIGNTMKRISVIVSSIIIFHTPVQPVNALGAALAISWQHSFTHSEAVKIENAAVGESLRSLPESSSLAD
ncbi:hypothetical protein MLD38_009986 [Melastoma candidum]|nr:hypothetical protein MLD38_009986 [Melastoma candidum]